MNKRPTLNNMLLDVWLLDTIMKAGAEGITLIELQMLWNTYSNSEGKLSRTTFNRHREWLSNMFQVDIGCTRYHYFITNPEVLALDCLANDLLASLQEYLFLDRYRDLGDAIQPQQIWEGLVYLHPIGDAIRSHRKLKIRYQKFTDDEPYDAIVQPYCLKAFEGRWYILAYKEQSEHPIQTFALDRTLHLHPLKETFKPDPTIDVKTYFNNAFGIWVDEDSYPVRDVVVTVPKWVVKYWRTLPLHHSQKELPEYRDTDTPRFLFHLSPTPDFISELKKWDAKMEEG